MIIIDNIKQEYIDGICEVENKSFAIAWSKKSFEAELKNENAVYRIAVSDGAVVGYGGFWRVLDEGDITNIAVLPEFRRCGVASRIMESLIKYCRQNGISKLTLEVRKSNTAAKQLYSKYGFKEIGFRKSYYADNHEDALIMALDLHERENTDE